MCGEKQMDLYLRTKLPRLHRIAGLEYGAFDNNNEARTQMKAVRLDTEFDEPWFWARLVPDSSDELAGSDEQILKAIRTEIDERCERPGY